MNHLPLHKMAAARNGGVFQSDFSIKQNMETWMDGGVYFENE